MNSHLKNLSIVARTYADHLGLSISHVSKLSTGGGKVLQNIEGGADMTTGRLLSTLTWFSTNWPAGADWPDDIERPIVSPVSTPQPIQEANR